VPMVEFGELIEGIKRMGLGEEKGKVGSCGMPARWKIEGNGYGPVYLCEKHRMGAGIMKYVRKGILTIKSGEGLGKKCEYVCWKREGPGVFPRP